MILVEWGMKRKLGWGGDDKRGLEYDSEADEVLEIMVVISMESFGDYSWPDDHILCVKNQVVRNLVAVKLD